MYPQLYKSIDTIFQLLYLALLIRVFLSWIPHNAYNRFIIIIYQVTDPMLKPFQNLLNTYNIGFDLSPLIAFFALGILKDIVFRILSLFL